MKFLKHLFAICLAIMSLTSLSFAGQKDDLELGLYELKNDVYHEQEIGQNMARTYLNEVMELEVLKKGDYKYIIEFSGIEYMKDHRILVDDKETDIETGIETDRQEKHFESKCQSKSQADSLSENKSIPTLEEVAEYVKNNNIKIDPVKFYAKNNARGWVTKEGKPVKRWKTLLLSWAEHEKGYESDSSTFRQNDYDFERLEEELTRN